MNEVEVDLKEMLEDAKTDDDIDIESVKHAQTYYDLTKHINNRGALGLHPDGQACFDYFSETAHKYMLDIAFNPNGKVTYAYVRGEKHPIDPERRIINESCRGNFDMLHKGIPSYFYKLLEEIQI